MEVSQVRLTFAQDSKIVVLCGGRHLFSSRVCQYFQGIWFCRKHGTQAKI